MTIESMYNSKGKKYSQVMISDAGVFENGKKIANRRYRVHGINYGALGTYDTKKQAQILIKRRREIHGNRYRHFTKKAGSRYIVYIGSNKVK